MSEAMTAHTLLKADNIAPTGLVDPFGRQVTYLRLSVTDRCDLRCTYCMAENMTFLPKKDLLTLEELDQIASAFIKRGVRKLRITGGEPLVRRDVMELIEALSRHLVTGALQELTLTTNATQLARFADRLARAGMRRINVSIDSLDPDSFRRITRGGDLSKVLAGIEAAQKAGIKIKLNCVALKSDNAEQIPDMIRWAHDRDIDVTLIEAMPMGEISEDRYDQYISLGDIKTKLKETLTLTPSTHRTGGPARYVTVEETGGQLGFITPMSHNFCESCNRVRLTCTGQLYPCLGQDNMTDLRQVIRDQNEPLDAAIDRAIGIKPKGHDFDISHSGQAPAVARHMSTTGG